jgi:hypothetical protein
VLALEGRDALRGHDAHGTMAGTLLLKC